MKLATFDNPESMARASEQMTAAIAASFPPSPTPLPAPKATRVMSNSLTDLNDRLFAQMDRLGQDDLAPETIETEAKRAGAMVAVADNILKNAALQMNGARLIAEHGDAALRNVPMIAGPSDEG